MVATHSASVFFAGGLIAVIPNVADEVFHSRVFGTSMLNISMAIGAILITIFYTTIANKYGKNKTLAILARFVPLTVLAFGFAPNLLIGCLVIAFFGITHMGTLTGIITEIQLLAPPDLKGKVSSVFSVILGTFLLLATLTYGYLIDAFDARFAFSVIAIGHVTVQLVIGLYSHKWGIRATYNIIEDDVKVVVPEVEDISPLIDL